MINESLQLVNDNDDRNNFIARSRFGDSLNFSSRYLFKNFSDVTFQKSVENFIVVKDYVAEDDEGFSVNVGDIVEAVDYLHDSTKWVKNHSD